MITTNGLFIAQAIEAAPTASEAQVATEVPATPDAATCDAAAQQPQGLFGGSGILMWVLLLVGMYFLMFYPQRKRQKALQKMQNELKVGDSVYTTSGIVGKIVSLDETTVTLQVSEGTRIPFLRNAVLGLAGTEAAK